MRREPSGKIKALYNSLNVYERDEMYRLLWIDYVRDDIEDYVLNIDKDLDIKPSDIRIISEMYVCDGEYDCDLSYWQNIENLINNYIRTRKEKTLWQK